MASYQPYPGCLVGKASMHRVNLLKQEDHQAVWKACQMCSMDVCGNRFKLQMAQHSCLSKTIMVCFLTWKASKVLHWSVIIYGVTKSTSRGVIKTWKCYSCWSNTWSKRAPTNCEFLYHSTSLWAFGANSLRYSVCRLWFAYWSQMVLLFKLVSESWVLTTLCKFFMWIWLPRLFGFDRSKWKMWMNSKHRENIASILQCTTKTAQSAKESEVGCRYTALPQLPYFDPVKMLAIDPMHNLYPWNCKACST